MNTRGSEVIPSNRKIVAGSILEIDDASLDSDGKFRDMWAWSIAGKRYATFAYEGDRPVLAFSSRRLTGGSTSSRALTETHTRIRGPSALAHAQTLEPSESLRIGADTE